jgi:hypothetical protein
MRYDEFRDRLQDALRETGLLFRQTGRMAENIDVAGADRHWEIFLLHSPARDPAPFNVSARVAFAWDPVNAARANTCEEDLLTAVLGRKQRYPKTQPRWTRVDLGLYATLPYGSPTPMPDSQLLGPWISSLGETLDKLLTEFKEREGQIVAITGGREDVAVEARGGSDGVLFLKGVSASGFRIIRIPRVWDDPVRREAEKDIGKELTSLAQRFKDTLDEWGKSVADLAGWIRYAPPPPGTAPAEPQFEDEGEDPETIH